jgi:hypothetical protein
MSTATVITEAEITASLVAAAKTLADGSRYYPYPGTLEPLDSVTTIISATNSKPWIGYWKGRQSSAWVIDNWAIVARVMAEEGAGSEISIPLLPDHLQEALYDLGGGDFQFVADVTEWMTDGFVNFVSAFGSALRFLATEMAVYNQPLGWAGTLDGIAELDGYAISIGTGPRGTDEITASPGSVLRICFDTKTGKDMEGTWKEQLAAYRRATECLLPLGDLRPMPATDCGAVLHLRPEYPDGWLLTLVSAGDDEAAWERFSKAASIYRERQAVKAKPGPSIRPLRADGTMPGPRLCDVAGEGYGRALAPLRKSLGGAAELEDLAGFTAADVLAVKGVGPKLIDAIREMLAGYGLCLADENAVVAA